MKVLLTRAAGACVLACWACACAAADSNAISLREAIGLVTARNPELAAFQQQTTAAREQAAVQALGPPLTLDLQLENFAGSGELSGIDALETTLQLSRLVELGGKAQARRDLGEFEVERLTAEQRSRQADVLAEVAKRFVHVLADQEELKAMQRAAMLAEAASASARSRVEAGAASPVQFSRAEIALARTRIDVEHAEHELLAARVALSTQWREEAPQFGAAEGQLFALKEVEPFEAFARRLQANPELLAFASHDRVAEARTRLAQSQQRPDLNLSFGVRRLEAFDDAAFVAGFSMPLRSARRAQGEIRAAQAERDSLALTREARRLELHATLFGIYQELAHARTEAQALQLRIRPQALDMLRTTEAGYRAGRFSFLELADAQRQLLEIELDAIRAAAEFHTQLIELERLTGQPVTTFIDGEPR